MCQRTQTLANRVGAANHAGGQKVVDGGALLRLQLGCKIFYRWLQATPVAAQNAEHTLVGAACQVLGFLVGRRGNQRHGNDGVRLGQRGRGTEILPVNT